MEELKQEPVRLSANEMYSLLSEIRDKIDKSNEILEDILKTDKDIEKILSNQGTVRSHVSVGASTQGISSSPQKSVPVSGGVDLSKLSPKQLEAYEKARKRTQVSGVEEAPWMNQPTPIDPNNMGIAPPATRSISDLAAQVGIPMQDLKGEGGSPGMMGDMTGRDVSKLFGNME